MIDEASVRAVGNAHWGAHFMRPLYGSYCFSEIPGLIAALFEDGDNAGQAHLLLGPLAGRYERVVLLFVDAFGWRFFERYADRYPFLRRFLDEGLATKLTAQFPSTTAAHVTAIHTGLPVGQSGVYEWFYFEPSVGALIAPLLFSFAGDRERGTLLGAGVDPAAIFPTTTLYQALASRGVRSSVLLHRDLVSSPYGRVVQAGAHLFPYATLAEAITTLGDLLVAERGRAYAFLYIDGIDAVGHRHGPNAPQFDVAVDLCFNALEDLLHRRLAGALADTLLLLIADHGQAAIDPATTVYLNHRLPAIIPWLAVDRRGRPLVPAGSCRDMFLHVLPEHLDEAEAALRGLLAGKAEVHRVDDLIAQGFFGAEPPSAAFLARVGNLVILPYQGQSVWWHEQGRFEQRHYGAHGGLTPEEMVVPLLALPYG